jgi:hypothetical protein
MKTMTQAALTAKLVRKELKQLYPDVQFKVRSDNFSMGDSVDVVYQTGTLTNEQHRALQDELQAKYQYGNFDGMTDSYEYDNRQDHAQTKYLGVGSTSDLSRY